MRGIPVLRRNAGERRPCAVSGHSSALVRGAEAVIELGNCRWPNSRRPASHYAGGKKSLRTSHSDETDRASGTEQRRATNHRIETYDRQSSLRLVDGLLGQALQDAGARA